LPSLTHPFMAPATVLLIDTDVDSIAIYSLILRHHGYDVIHATDAETGLQLAFESQPDVVVSELFLPRVRGGDVIQHLRNDDRTADTPLIVLDSIPTFARELTDSLGDLSRLTKPCEPSRLLQEIERLLERPVPVPQ
jgi:CheY-like chemotaxis protein